MRDDQLEILIAIIGGQQTEIDYDAPAELIEGADGPVGVMPGATKPAIITGFAPTPEVWEEIARYLIRERNSK